MAVIAGVESAVQVHIDRGDDLNARDSNGMTPLMLSAARNRSAVCRLLLNAGADHHLLDPSGKTAHAIAIASGARETAVILAAAQTARLAAPGPLTDPSPEAVHIDVPHAPTIGTGPALEEQADFAPGAHAIGDSKVQRTTDADIEVDEAADFDLSGWVAEEESIPPEADHSLLQAASATQNTISAHEPIDSSAEWDDIEACLPDLASPLARNDDAEARAQLRLLLLRAIREGSVPSHDVEALSTNEDRSPNPEAEAVLSMILNDLGAEVDERSEFAGAAEVFVDPEEAPEEEAALDEALAALASVISAGNEPLRLYQRAFQRLRLISAQEEVTLGQTMENALGAALDALAAWPLGVSSTLATAAKVKAGIFPVSWMSLGEAEPDNEPISAEDQGVEALVAQEDGDEGEEEEGAPEDDTEGSAELSTDAGFVIAIHQLANLPVGTDDHGPTFRAVRDALAALRLNRRFLLQLCVIKDPSHASVRFEQAMADYRQARDRMTTANLKLVFHLAKKYLYSGEPLDDLAQEGNIGLLKAVDRYDWRRGFKFSTYATWWIRQSIGRYVADRSRTIRVPVHIYEKIQRLQRESRAFESAFGRTPTAADIAPRLEMPMHRVAALQRIAPDTLPIHELAVDELMAFEVRDRFISQDPADLVSKTSLRNAIDDLLAALSPREEQVLRLRFGLAVQDSFTLEEIGQRYEVTRERIRQIEAKAIRKLQQPARREAFARAALGVSAAKKHAETVADEGEATAKVETAELAGSPPPRKQRGAPEHAQQVSEASSQDRPSSLDRLLSRAIELGIAIEDDREGPSGRLWVNLTAAPDNRYRRLARKLINRGFEHWPGKGYWK